MGQGVLKSSQVKSSLLQALVKEVIGWWEENETEAPGALAPSTGSEGPGCAVANEIPSNFYGKKHTKKLHKTWQKPKSRNTCKPPVTSKQMVLSEMYGKIERNDTNLANTEKKRPRQVQFHVVHERVSAATKSSSRSVCCMNMIIRYDFPTKGVGESWFLKVLNTTRWSNIFWPLLLGTPSKI